MIRRGLRLCDWPKPDHIAWIAAIADGDIFDGRGPAVHWAPTTRDGVIAAYGRWLGFVAESEPSTLAEHPVERLTRERVLRYLDHLAETAGTVGRHMFIAKLRDAIRVMFPGKVPHMLHQLVRRLERECQPSSKASRVVSTQRLTVLSKKLMKQAIDSEGNVTDIVAYRDGLMIGVLAWRPVRRPETKSRRPFEVSIPEWIAPFLERYLGEARPAFFGATLHDGLWASTKGGPLTDKAIYRIITGRTRAAFGHAVNPHLFLACAATTIALLDPGRIGIARDLLAHVSLATTHAYYNKARSIEVSRLYARVLAAACSEAKRATR